MPRVQVSANREIGCSECIQEGCGGNKEGSGFALGRQLKGSGKWSQMLWTNHGGIQLTLRPTL